MIEALTTTGTLTANELFNGMWAIASGILLVILIRYIWRVRAFNMRQGHSRWWNDTGVVFAGAMCVMVFGHHVRAVAQWMQYVFYRGGDTQNIFASVYVVATAMFFIILGKVLIFYAFTPYRYRKCIVGTSVLAIVAIPLLVYFYIWT